MKRGAPPSKRATVRRRPERASYDPAVINAILDEALVCHVAFIHNGDPVVIPISHARVGDTLYFHGARAGRAMQALAGGQPVCIEVTILDGIVLGATPTGHSMNYRSAVVFGAGREVTDPDEKLEALKAIMDHVLPGRWEDVPGPAARDVAATLVAAVPITEASAKVRSGPPAAPEKERSTSRWTGTLPLRLCAGEPLPGPGVDAAIAEPGYLRGYRRGSSRAEAGIR